MAMRMRVGWLAVVTALATISSTSPAAWVASGVTWAGPIVGYYVNSANLDLSPSSIEPAVRVGADAWLQSGAGVRFSSAGLSTQSTTGNDGVNLVVFRNDKNTNPSAIATTYWWSMGGHIIDADIVFWDAAFTFFTGSTGCSNGLYIEDIAAHEFGHALGLLHSTLSSATMYSSTSFCNSGSRSLDADDVAGVRALYPPPIGTPKAPTGFRIIF